MKQRKIMVGTLLTLCSLGLASCMNGALSSSMSEGPGDSSSPTGEYEHTFSDTWSYDENMHWHEATCGHDVRKSEGQHVFSLETEATDAARYICDVCGYEKSVKILSFTLSENNKSYSVKGKSDYSSLPVSITIPGERNGLPVTEIDPKAFDSWNKSKSISIPKSVESIGVGAFQYCALESIMVEKGNSTYHCCGNCLIETDSKTLVVGCKNSIIATDGSVVTIDDSAFAGCKLVSLIVPHSITTIEKGAFEFAFDST